MSVAKVMTCDRCKAEYPYGKGIMLQRRVMESNHYSRDGYIPGRPMESDLCADCSKELTKWIEEKE